MFPMPGYVTDNGTKFGTSVLIDDEPDDPNGMLKYQPTALFFYTRTNSTTSFTMMALGTRADGTGWKLIGKLNPEATCWTPDEAIDNPGILAEGSETLVRGTYLISDDPGGWDNTNFITINGSKTYIGEYASSTWNPQLAEVWPFAITNPLSGRMIAEVGPDGAVYTQRIHGAANIWKLDGSPASAKTTSVFPYDLQRGGDQLGYIGVSLDNQRNSVLVLWDTAGTLADQRVELSSGTGRSLGYVDGAWICVTDVNERSYTDAGEPSFLVQYVSGSVPIHIAKVYGKSTTGKKLQPVRTQFRGAHLFEAKLATNTEGTEFKQGIWAVGRATANSPFALSLLYDTTNLGAIEDMKMYDNYAYFIHGDNYSISRTDNIQTGTYDETAVYESLWFGSDTPNEKNFNGISIHTEELPSGATIEVKYRFDDDDSWTSFGTHTTANQQIHNFTASTPIGTFKEIQFRVEVTGNAPIKNIYISLDELDTTPYDS
jgi:hypothetical protein